MTRRVHPALAGRGGQEALSVRSLCASLPATRRDFFSLPFIILHGVMIPMRRSVCGVFGILPWGWVYGGRLCLTALDVWAGWSYGWSYDILVGCGS